VIAPGQPGRQHQRAALDPLSAQLRLGAQRQVGEGHLAPGLATILHGKPPGDGTRSGRQRERNGGPVIVAAQHEHGWQSPLPLPALQLPQRRIRSGLVRRLHAHRREQRALGLGAGAHQLAAHVVVLRLDPHALGQRIEGGGAILFHLHRPSSSMLQRTVQGAKPLPVPALPSSQMTRPAPAGNPST
jgi:hypothetical protein